ncbi:MAG: preprotein translocase subunit SecG [Ruminococcaceae bacterium]|nr:preprotein translocase subunit SecG [Oscillospiraceae bacterium]
MDVFVTILCVFLIIFAIAITVLVSMQSGKNTGMSAISGNSDTFYGKAKSKQKEAILSKLTTILSIVFVIVAIVVYILQ